MLQDHDGSRARAGRLIRRRDRERYTWRYKLVRMNYADGGDAFLMEKTLGGNPPTGRSREAETPYLRRGRR
jgi:hypothetical protein